MVETQYKTDIIEWMSDAGGNINQRPSLSFSRIRGYAYRKVSPMCINKTEELRD